MFKILLVGALLGIGSFCIFIYLRWRAEAKDEGFVSDEYIENNEEEVKNDTHQN